MNDIQEFYKINKKYCSSNLVFIKTMIHPTAMLIDFGNSCIKNNLSTNVPSVLELFEVDLLWPITIANAQRSFSTVWHLKTYLRSLKQNGARKIERLSSNDY